MSLIDFEPESLDRSAAGFIARRLATARLSDKEIESIGQEPFGHIESIFGIEVRIDPRLESTADCGVPATYDPTTDPPVIHINLSGNGSRDNFSLLHELAHHLLHEDEEWGYEISPRLGVASRKHEDSVANYFAGLILVNDEAIRRAVSDRSMVSAAALRQLFRETSASRSVVLNRVGGLGIGDQVVGFAKLDGEVQGARADGNIPRPATRSMQADLAELASRAVVGHDQRAASGSARFAYSTGRTFDDLSLDGAVDGEFLFFTGREAHLLRGSSYDEGEPFECPNCHRETYETWRLQRCARCGEGRCPHCHQCSCVTNNQLCSQCGTVLSLSDIARADGLCEFC